MIETWEIPVTPVTGKAPRRVYVYLPRTAKSKPKARFPVLYMFDGHNVFFDEDATYGKAWGMGEYLDRTETPLIVAAVDCNHRPPHGRLSEYAPFTFSAPGLGRVVGRGKRFMDWLTGTLKPRIDEKYATLPDREYTWIAGSSMGGLMSLYAVTARSDVFSRAAALSPSLWVAPDKTAALMRDGAKIEGTVVYMDYGSRELAGHPGMLDYFTDAAGALMRRGAAVTARIVPDGEHCEASWEKQIPLFLRVLMYGLEA